MTIFPEMRIKLAIGELVSSYESRHTYIHNWPFQPFSQDYGLVSHTIYVVYANFIHELRDL